MAVEVHFSLSPWGSLVQAASAGKTWGLWLTASFEGCFQSSSMHILALRMPSPPALFLGLETPWCVSWYPEKWELGDPSLCGEERLRLALLSAFLVWGQPTQAGPQLQELFHVADRSPKSILCCGMRIWGTEHTFTSLLVSVLFSTDRMVYLDCVVVVCVFVTASWGRNPVKSFSRKVLHLNKRRVSIKS